MERPPVLVLLAAGESRRLGTCKALVALRDEAPATPLALLLEAGAVLDGRAPVCVTGHHHDAIAAAAPPGVELLRNPAWREGRTGGVQRAAALLAGEDLCLAPIDVPVVPRRVFRRLAEAWEEAGRPPEGWLAPRVVTAAGPRHGHPVIVGRDLLRRLAAWLPHRPLRELRAEASPLLDVETDSASVLCDLDDLADLADLKAKFAAGEFL